MSPGAVWRVVTAFSIALIAAIWVFALSIPHTRQEAGPLDGLESLLLDLRMTSSGSVTPFDDLVIVAIDDPTLAAQNPLGPGRDKLAEIVSAIADAGAAVLAVDILLMEAQSPAVDGALAQALTKLPSVIAAAGRFNQINQHPGLPLGQDEFWPLPVFAEVAEIGMVNLSTDARGVPRHVPVGVVTSRGLELSLPVRAAALYTGDALSLERERLHLGNRVVPLDAAGHMPLRLAGPAGTIPTISALALLSDEAAREKKIDLSGKIALLGVTATGVGDRFPSAFSPDLPGVEVLAAAISQILSDRPLRRDSAIRKADRALAMSLAVLCALSALLLPLAFGVPLAIALLSAGLGMTWLAYQSGLWLNASLLLAGSVPPMILAAGLRYDRERRSAKDAKRGIETFRAFQSPGLADRLMRDATYLATPQTRSLIICFVDLTGSSALSQALGPNPTQALLKGFHDRVSRIADHHGGAVLSYLGDGALIAYGLLSDEPADADHALQAAQDMVASTRALGSELRLEAPLNCRVGLHWGDAVLSRLGAETHQQISLSGEAVNLCSRLLENARSHGAAIVATADFMTRLKAAPEPHGIAIRTELLRGIAGETELHYWPVPESKPEARLNPRHRK